MVEYINEWTDSRVPLAFFLNDLAYSTYSIGPYVLHTFFTILSLIPICLILKDRNKIIFFLLIFSTNIIFIKEVLRLYDKTLFTVIISWYLYFSIYTEKTKSFFGLLMLIFISAIGWYTRTTGIIFYLLLPSTVFLIFKSKKYSVLAFILFTSLILPLQIYNYIKHDSISLSAAQRINLGKYNFIKGNTFIASQVYLWIDLDHVDIKKVHQENGYSHDDLMVIYDFIIDQPLHFITLQARKVICFFYPMYTPIGFEEQIKFNGKDVNMTNWEATSFYSIKSLSVFHIPIFLYFVFFLFEGWRFSPMVHKQVCLMVCFYISFHSLIWMETRFRVPFDPIIYGSGVLYFFDMRKN